MMWYEVENVADVDTPALLLYKNRIQQNIATAIAMTGESSRLRPQIKTNKTAEVCRMMTDAGITKFKCATIAEAEMLGLMKASDVLLAYQPVGPKINRFINLIKAYPDTKFSCLVDNICSAREIDGKFGEQESSAMVWIDVNTGMNRTGVIPEAADALKDELLQLRWLDVIGIHFYDGHIVDSDADARRCASDTGFAKIEEVKNQFIKKTPRKLLIAGGGSPTFRSHITRDVECTPGTFVFWDMGYRNLLPEEPFVFAALVATRIVSIVSETLVTCDLGYKSVAAENPMPRVYFLNAPGVTPFYQNEEHLVLQVNGATKLKVGDILYGVPEHICPTVALFDEAVVIENDRVAGYWQVSARRKKINY